MEAREEEAQKEITRGVSLLIGEPKKALLKLSGPMIVAMLILAAYNLVNAVWVAGLGSDALAAVGFVTPTSSLRPRFKHFWSSNSHTPLN